MTKRDPSPNILLLYPETPLDSYWSFSHSLAMIGKKAVTPPLGLLTVAAMLPENEFALRLVDMNVRTLSDEDIAWADMVFVSAMIVQKASMEAVLRRVKAHDKTVVVGGPYSSTAYREIDNVDTFVIGEAEGVWSDFLADLRAGNLRPAYAAPVREKEAEEIRAYFGEQAFVAPATTYPEIALAPLPRFDLLDMPQYSIMSVQASRGCPVGCEFCDIWRRYGRKTRIKESDRVIAEMNELYRLGWRDSVFLVDDNFIGNRKRAKEILAELLTWQREHGWPFAFFTEATLSLADDTEMLDLMEEAGFTSVFVGIETPSEASLRQTGKQINLNGSMADKVAQIQARGIQVMSGFILGFDADPDDIADRMIACVQELGIPQAMIGLLNALPDTDLHDRLEAENRVSHSTTGNNTHAFAMNFRPVRPEADILADYKRILEATYPADMKAYFQRCGVLRERWPLKLKAKLKLPLGWKLKVLAKYLVTVAASPYRFSALAFFVQTALVKPSFMQQAFELAIKGHHLWAITRQAFEVEAMRTSLSTHLHNLTAYAQQRLDALDGVLARVQPQGIEYGENALDALTRLVDSLDDMCSDVADSTALRQRVEETVAEVRGYGRNVREQVEHEYTRLSEAARSALVDDMESFLRELSRRSAS